MRLSLMHGDVKHSIGPCRKCFAIGTHTMLDVINYSSARALSTVELFNVTFYTAECVIRWRKTDNRYRLKFVARARARCNPGFMCF